MNYIEQMVAELCPEGVEFKTVGELASYTRGVTYSKNDERIDGTIRVLRSNNITLPSNTINFDDVKLISSTVRIRDNQWLRANDILISAASGSKAHVGKVAYINEDMDYCCGGFMAILRTQGQIDSRFLFHLLIGRRFSDYLDSTLSTTTINNLNASTMNAFRVPIPPLPIQQEIVRVLDKFSQLVKELQANLQAELVARRKQYQYYRDQLLDFDAATLPNSTKTPRIHQLLQELCPQGVEFRELGEVITALRTGLNPRQNFKLNTADAKNYYVTVRELEGFTIRVSDKTDRVDDAGLTLIQNRSKLQAGDVLFSGTGTIGRTAFIAEEPKDWNIKEGIYAITPAPKIIDPKFLIYLFHSSRIHGQILAQADGSTVVSIGMATLRKIRIPIPPLEVQQEIVSILDKFDALVNDLSIGLPAEIAARQKQYEYYRDRLLTFPEAARTEVAEGL